MSKPQDVPASFSSRRFTFSFDLVSDAEKDLKLRIEAAEEFIKKVEDFCTIEVDNAPAPWPIIKAILQITSSEEELTRLGKGLVKIAPVVKELSELRKRSDFISLANDQQSWVMASFGDFATDFDTLDNINQITDQITNLEDII